MGFAKDKILSLNIVPSTMRAVHLSARPNWCGAQPDLLVIAGPEVALQAVIGASGHIPIVMFAINFDPIERGYVTSLAQPSGNITGVIVRPLDLARKQIDLLRQVFPDRNRVAVLYDTQSADQFTAAEQGAKSLNLQVQAFKVDPAYDFAGIFEAAAKGGAQLVIVQSSPAFAKHRENSQSLRSSIGCPPCLPLGTIPMPVG